MTFRAAIPVFAAVCLVSYADGQKARPASPPPPPRPQPHASAPRPRPAEGQPKRPASEAGNPAASPVALNRLLKLSPEQRTRALSSLPAPRRAQIEKKLEEYQKIPPQQRARELERYQRMHDLPPLKQQQVRASVQKLTLLPEHRRKLVQKQLNEMKSLSDADRSAMMNSEEFRSKFTPGEQQIIEDVGLITPRN